MQFLVGDRHAKQKLHRLLRISGKIGEQLLVKVAVNRSWRSSMEIGVHVAAEDSYTGDTRHVVSAYLTFVALDKHGKTHAVPAVLPETDIEKRRYDKAQMRRDGRLSSR